MISGVFLTVRKAYLRLGLKNRIISERYCPLFPGQAKNIQKMMPLSV
jgi:hypothetical protein